MNKMKIFNLILISKCKVTVKKFFLFFFKNKLQNEKIQKYLNKKIKKKKLTVLKSPHIYKKAQEQFQNIFIKKHIEIQTTKNFKYLLFLKRLNSKLFPNIQIKLKCTINNGNMKKLNVFSPKNFKIKEYYIFKNQNLNLKNNNLSKPLIALKVICLLKIFFQFNKLSWKC